MHSGADVEAFQAALNRDIEGDASTSQPPDSDTGITFLIAWFSFSCFLFAEIWLPIWRIWFRKK